MRLFRFLAVTLVCFAYSASPSPASAAPKNEASAISTIAKDLLNQAKNTLLTYRNFYKDLQEHPERYDTVRQAIQEDHTLALEQNENRARELADAIQAKVELLTTELVLPHAVALHQGMLELVADYKGQACAPGGDPLLCIGGVWNRRRSAMGAIIDSQAADIQALENTGDGAAVKIASIALEMENLGVNPGLLEFGNQHYVNKRRVALQTLRDTVADLSPIFDGRTLSGQNVTVYLPCIIGTQVPLRTFRSELLTIRSAAGQYAADHEAWTNFMLAYAEYYDGNASSAGVLSHWGGCMASKQLQINTLQAALNQALSEGNTALAAIFDASINQLQMEIDKHSAELAVLQLRRSQLAAVLASEGAQYDSENPSNLSWLLTVMAHTDNLLNGMLHYPSALRAMHAVIDDALTALAPLDGVTDPISFQNLSRAASVRLRTDISHGLERLKTELNFIGQTVLPNLAQAIRIGESALTSNIDTYQGILALHFQAVQNELNSLPVRLAQANLDITRAQTNFDNADQFVRSLLAALVSHDQSVLAINAAAGALETLLGLPRFNPVFTDLANNFLNAMRTERRFKKSSSKVQSSMRKLLKKFDGHTPGPAKVFRCKNRKGVCSSALVRKAVSRREQIRAQLGPVLDEISRPYLGGSSVGELMDSIQGHHASIMSRAH